MLPTEATQCTHHASQRHDERLSNHATKARYEKKGAVPLTEAEVHLLLNNMHNQFSSITNSTQQLLMLRDGPLFNRCSIWQTCFNGFNAGGVRLDNIVLPTGG